MKNNNCIVIDFTNVYGSHRINPLSADYIRTIDDAINLSSHLVGSLFGHHYGHTLADNCLKKATENFLAATIFFFVNYDVTPYDKNWVELTEEVVKEHDDKPLRDDKGNVIRKYYYKDGREAEFYRYKGRYADLPHVLQFLMQEYTTIFDILLMEEKVTYLIQPIVKAMQEKRIEFVDEVCGPLRIYLARLMSPEVYWVLSGDDFRSASCANPTSVILLQEEGVNDSIKVLNDMLRLVYHKQAVIKGLEEKGFFGKRLVNGLTGYTRSFSFYDKEHMQHELTWVCRYTLRDIEKMVERLLGVDEIVDFYFDKEQSTDFQDNEIDYYLPVEEDLSQFVEGKINLAADTPVPLEVYWAPPGHSFRVGDYNITRGGVYLYHGQWSDIKHLPMASFVVVEKTDDCSDKNWSVDYQGYYNMTAERRHKYLCWLAGDVPVAELDESLFCYYMHGICYRLFVDSMVEDRRDAFELLQNLLDETILDDEKFKKEVDVLNLQMNSIGGDDFYADYLVHKWTRQMDGMPKEEDKVLLSNVAEYDKLEKKKKELEEKIQTMEQYISILLDIRQSANDCFPLEGGDVCRQLLELAGGCYDEADVDEVKEIIGKKEKLFAADAYNLSLSLGLVEPADWAAFHLKGRKLFVDKFREQYPDGLTVNAKLKMLQLKSMLHLTGIFYNPDIKLLYVKPSYEGVFQPELLFNSLKKFSDIFNIDMEVSFWAYMNGMRRNKDKITPYSLLCLPKEVSLDKLEVLSYLSKLADLFFQGRDLLVVPFSNLLHFLGYPLYPGENIFKYYKAKSLVGGLRRVGIRIYCKEISLKSAEVYPCRNIPLDTVCILWKEDIQEYAVYDEWDDIYDYLKDICTLLLDAGNCTEDRMIVDKFISDVQPYTLKLNLRVLLYWHTLVPRKYKRKKWAVAEYRKEVCRQVKAKVKTLKKKIDKANKKVLASDEERIQ